MALIARSIDVNAPLRAVYDQWTRFEEFPFFMEGVEEVRLESEKFLLGKVKIAGKIKTGRPRLRAKFRTKRSRGRV